MAKILVVDDSPTILYMVAEMLNSGGHEALRAMDGEMALDMATKRVPDVVLLDVILPKLNGYQVCRELKSRAETAHIPVILITRKSREADRQWGLEQGADAYITKPFNADDLLEIVNQQLQMVEA